MKHLILITLLSLVIVGCGNNQADYPAESDCDTDYCEENGCNKHCPLPLGLEDSEVNS